MRDMLSHVLCALIAHAPAVARNKRRRHGDMTTVDFKRARCTEPLQIRVVTAQPTHSSAWRCRTRFARPHARKIGITH